MLVKNRLEESGRPVVDVTICSDEVRVEEADIDKRWPLPQNWTRVDRVVTDDQDDLFDDAGWDRVAARAIYVWVRIEESGVTDFPGEEDYEWMWFADFPTRRSSLSE